MQFAGIGIYHADFDQTKKNFLLVSTSRIDKHKHNPTTKPQMVQIDRVVSKVSQIGKDLLFVRRGGVSVRVFLHQHTNE